MIDHERIYLEPSPGADEDYGRQWCQHNVWDEATEYVRADLHEAAVEERDRLREENRASKVLLESKDETIRQLTEERAEQWRKRRDAEGSRDAGHAAADSLRIEPLEWVDMGEGPRCITVCGMYAIHPSSGPYGTPTVTLTGMPGNLFGKFATVDEAKVSAQADYEQRINSALVPFPQRCPCTMFEQDESTTPKATACDRLRDENDMLKANIDRLASNPADHRYWEGRYRDEANENDKLREAIIDACDLLMERKPGSLSRSPIHNARLRMEAAVGHWNGRALSPHNSTQKEG